MDAALACYEDGALAGVSIEAVARRSGASVGSIYHHFGSKEGILAALYLDALDAYRSALRAQLEAQRSPEGLIKTVVQQHINYVVGHPTAARLLLQQRRNPAVQEVDARIRGETRDLLRELFGRLRQAIDDGAVRALPLPLYTPLILGPAQELARRWLQRDLPELDMTLAARALADAAWRSIAQE